MTGSTWTAEQFISSNGPKPAWPLLQEMSVAILLFLVLTVFIDGWYAPSFAKWMPLAALGGVCWLRLGIAATRGSLSIDFVDLIALALFIWAAISLRWSADATTGIDTLIHWLMLLSIFLLLRREMSPRQVLFIGAAAVAGAVTILVFVYFKIGHYGGYYNTNLITETLLALLPMLIPVYLHFFNSRIRWYVLAVTLVSAIYLLFVNESKIGFAVWGALAMFFVTARCFRKSRRAGWLSVAAFLLGGVAFVVIGWDGLGIFQKKGFSPSVLPRIEYALNTLYVWQTAPIIGTGAGGFNAVFAYHHDDHRQLMNVSPDNPIVNPLFMTAGASHNDILQFAASYGLIGVAIVALGIWTAYPAIRQWRTSPTRLAGIAIVISVLTNSQLEFPLQMPATLLLFTMGLAWLLPLNTMGTTTREKNLPLVIEAKVLTVVLSIGAIAVIGWWGWNFLPAQRSFAGTLKMIHVDPQQAMVHNENAINRYPFDDMFRRQYLITLMRWDESKATRVIPPEGYDKVFEVTNSVGPVTGTLVLRLQYLLQSGRHLVLKEETQKWRDLLKSQSSRVPDVWLIEAVFEAQAMNRAGVEKALERYQILTKGITPENRKLVVASLQSDLKQMAINESKTDPLKPK